MSLRACLSQRNVSATCLNSGPDHAFVLLSSPDKPSAVLKLKKSPSTLHNTAFPTKANRSSTPEEPESPCSRNIIQLLSLFAETLTSESGKEYSYHKFSVNTATFLARYCLHQFTPTFLVPYFSSPFLASLSSSSLLQYDAELISPASSKQITRCLPASKLVLINETPALYAAVVKPYIAQVVSSGAIGWVSKIVAGEKELERRLHDGDEFMIGVDTKWTSLDCKNLPREQWKGHESVRDLYCLAIVKDSKLASLRDLTGSHVAMLRSVESTGKAVIEDTFGVPGNELRVFVHYMPQFYQLHVHFTRLYNAGGAQVERAHMVADVCDNLELSGSYYKDRIMRYKLPVEDKLCKLLVEE